MRIFMLLLLTFFLTIVKKKAFLTKIKTFSYRTNIHKVPLKSIHLSAHVSIYRPSLPLDGALAKMCLKIGTPARRTEDRMRSNSPVSLPPTDLRFSSLTSVARTRTKAARALKRVQL